MYGELVNGYLFYAPKNYKTVSGQIITNFNENEELMKKYGFKKIIDEKPEHDRFLQEAKVVSYEETEDTIIRKYIIVDKTPSQNSLESRVNALETEISLLGVIFDEEVNK